MATQRMRPESSVAEVPRQMVPRWQLFLITCSGQTAKWRAARTLALLLPGVASRGALVWAVSVTGVGGR